MPFAPLPFITPSPYLRHYVPDFLDFLRYATLASYQWAHPRLLLLLAAVPLLCGARRLLARGRPRVAVAAGPTPAGRADAHPVRRPLAPPRLPPAVDRPGRGLLRTVPLADSILAPIPIRALSSGCSGGDLATLDRSISARSATACF